MTLYFLTPFDDDAGPDRDTALKPAADAVHEPELERSPFDWPVVTKKKARHWWGLAGDGCYIMIEAGAFLMACWVMAMGLPLMFLLLLSGGQIDMMFAFLGTMFGAFAEASPDRQNSFASDATWCLVALATLIAALRLPRFLDSVAAKLDASRHFT
jgi:hypothetical protein